MGPHGRVPMRVGNGDGFPAALCAGVALSGAWRAARASPWFLAFGLSLLAIQGVGLIDSVIDSPRFMQLYLTLALLAWSLGSAKWPAGRREPLPTSRDP